MREGNRIHWRQPAIMVGALLGAVLFALGHHLFYQHLEGRQAPNAEVSSMSLHLAQQQFNTSVGTAFAFLVKAAPPAALSAAYVQVFWRSVSRKGAESKVADLDAIYSGSSSSLALLVVPVWVKYPLLFLLAIIVFLAPLATIVTPAMLSVEVRPVEPPPSTFRQTPNLDFTNLDLLNSLQFASYAYNYAGPSQLVQKIAVATAAQGAILPINSPGINASWTLQVPGPSLSCVAVNEDSRSAIKHSLYAWTEKNSTTCESPYVYMAWTGSLDTTTAMWEMGLPRDELPTPTTLSPYAGAESDSDAEAVVPRFWVAAMPNALTLANVMQNGTSSNGTVVQFPALEPKTCASNTSEFLDDATFLECHLYNRTYELAFSYPNGDQTVNVNVDLSEDDQPLPLLDASWLVESGTDILPATDTKRDGRRSLNCTVDSTDFQGCIFDPAYVQSFTYQAVLDAFSYLFMGSIYYQPGGSLISTTGISRTPLLATKELQFVSDFSGGPTPDLQHFVENSSNSRLEGLMNDQATGTTQSLARALEDLFRNITISLMSTPQLLPKANSTYGPAPVEVSFNVWEPTYRYDSAKLWLAYGLAIGIATIAVLIGLAAILVSGASYSNGFTTILRATRNAKVSVQMLDDSASDPLPEHLTKAQISLLARPRRLRSGGYVEVKQQVSRGGASSLSTLASSGSQDIETGATSEMERSSRD